MDKKRLFIGIPINKDIAKNFLNFQLENKNLSFVKWVPNINYHVTLYFIGDYPISEINTLLIKIQNLASNYNHFALNFNGFCLAPERKPYMIWAKYDKNETFIHLSDGLSKLFHHKSSYKPIPHVTLARYNNKKTKSIFNNLESKHLIQVSKFCLYESVLKPSGAEYKILENFSLNND